MNTTAAYVHRRGELETYFDRTASDAWTQLTSDAPVSKIRATVRAGRDRMRATILSWLPQRLDGRSVLDAGCGTGALAAEAAARGAHVTAVDVSASLIDVARDRVGDAAIGFHVGDMLDPAFGDFDHVVAMDSLIHYEPADVVNALAGLAVRTHGSIVFTHAPRTPALTAMHVAGRLFPRGDRAPAIVPVTHTTLVKTIEADPRLAALKVGRTDRIASGFYTSQAVELVRR
jgi:magnesium-protoporphyrin O-methyltransferase